MARRRALSIKDIADQPLIVPDRLSRPHSYDLTMKLFNEAGIAPRVAQLADEKQTIVNLVSAGLGSAIVPRWTSRMKVDGVAFLRLVLDGGAEIGRLPLAAVWIHDSRDPLRDSLLETLMTHIERYAAKA